MLIKKELHNNIHISKDFRSFFTCIHEHRNDLGRKLLDSAICCLWIVWLLIGAALQEADEEEQEQARQEELEKP